jgi:hypothetical protein
MAFEFREIQTKQRKEYKLKPTSKQSKPIPIQSSQRETKEESK